MLTQPPARAKFYVNRGSDGFIGRIINMDHTRLGELVEWLDDGLGDRKCLTEHIEMQPSQADTLWEIPKSKTELEEAGLM